MSLRYSDERRSDDILRDMHWGEKGPAGPARLPHQAPTEAVSDTLIDVPAGKVPAILCPQPFRDNS